MLKGQNVHIRFLYRICPDQSLKTLKGRFYQNLLLLVDVPPPLTVASIVIRIGLIMLSYPIIYSFVLQLQTVSGDVQFLSKNILTF